MTPHEEQRIYLHKHTRREFRQRMQSGELRAAILPVAATEQHLEHLAMEHDWRSVLHVAALVALQLQPGVIVAPSMNIGISEHHMRHIGTLSALPGGWLSVLADTIRSLHHAGFRNILVLNGHGGNVAPCLGLWGQFLQRFEINLHFQSYWDLLDKSLAESVLTTKRWPGHAQEFETAFALAAFPENVRRDAMHDQPDKEPLAGTAETGHKLIAGIVAGVSKYLQGMIDGSNVIPIPPFHA